MRYNTRLTILWTAMLSLIAVTTLEGQKPTFNAVIYTIREDGTLWWNNYKGAANGTDAWDEPKQVGSGWQDVLQVFSSKGKIYAVKEDGSLWWYDHRGAADGAATWNSKQVGSGWQNFSQVFTSNGKIYAIKEDGTLWWYNHRGAADGTPEWDDPKQVGVGWQNVVQIFGSGGKIYVVKKDGTLWWYNHKGVADGTFSWDAPKQVGTGWQDLIQVFGCNNRIYVIKKDGTLWWYNHKGVADGTGSWADAKEVAVGWDKFTRVIPRLTDDISPAAVPALIVTIAPVTPTVVGAIRDEYNFLNAGHGFVGAPLMNEQSTSDGKGKYQKFQNCVIYWHPSTGAHEVHGPIMDLYIHLGAEKTLGYPITDQRVCPDGKGKYNHFSKILSNGTQIESSIYWPPNDVPIQISGPIREKWKSIGWEKSILGYPSSHEYQSGQYRVQEFHRGKIIWSQSKGAVVEESKII